MLSKNVEQILYRKRDNRFSSNIKFNEKTVLVKCQEPRKLVPITGKEIQ